METFLRYIARRTSRGLEDIATEAVAHLVNNCSEAADGLQRLLSSYGVSLDQLELVPQEGSLDGGRPDLKVRNSLTGEIPVVIENKIWAGLTARQPLDYINSLTVQSGLLLFVVPEVRRKEVWDTVCSRCLNEFTQSVKERPSLRIGRHTVALVSWDMFLREISNDVPANFLVQVEQIKEIVHMDEIPGFQPLRETDLNIDSARVALTLMRLATIIANKAEESGSFAPRARQSSEASSQWWTGIYGRLADLEKVWIGYDAKLWFEHKVSPIWITFEMPSEVPRLKQQLSDWLKDNKCFVFPDRVVVPIPIETGQGQDEIVATAVNVIQKLATDIGSRRQATKFVSSK